MVFIFIYFLLKLKKKHFSNKKIKINTQQRKGGKNKYSKSQPRKWNQKEEKRTSGGEGRKEGGGTAKRRTNKIVVSSTNTSSTF